MTGTAANSESGADGGIRLGIRAKLFFAIGAVAAMTVVSAAVGQLSYVAVENRLASIARVSLPAMSNAKLLATESTSIAAAAPLLDAARNEAIRQRLLDDLNARSERLFSLIGLLDQAQDERVADLRARAEAMAEKMRELGAIVARRIELADARTRRVPEIARTHEEFLGAIEPMLAQAGAALRAQGGDLNRLAAESVAEVTDEASVNLIAVFEVRTDVTTLANTIGKAARALTVDEVVELAATFDEVAARVTTLLDRLRGQPDSDAAVASIERLVAIGTGDGSIFATREEELVNPLAGVRGSEMLADDASEIESELYALLQPIVTAARGRIGSAGEDLRFDVETGVRNLLIEGFAGYRSYLELTATGNLVAGILNEAANAQEPGRLPVLRERFETAHEAFGRQLAQLSSAEASRPTELIDRLTAFGAGADGVFAAREAELKAAADAAALLDQSRALAVELGKVVQDLVDEAQADTDRATGQAEDAIAQGRIWLLAIAATSIAGAVLIVWLYVGRVVAGRLQRLAEAMRGIARGNLDTPIPSGGRDEIAEMSRALGVFRDNALEVRAA
ncbi:MAG TPA: HAMP domain-containing protein, partial [Arenibaculum sp.]|nr:HAMP domain-containing protein [Arenibaculum sp.]